MNIIFKHIGETRVREFTLPIPPKSIMVKTGVDNEVVKLLNKGELAIKGKKKLDSITIKSFFPAQKYSYSRSDYIVPYQLVKQFRMWQFDETKPIYVTFEGTDIKEQSFLINSFSYGHKDSTGDVHFTLELVEYVNLNINKRDTSKLQENNTKNSENGSTVYTVVAGDTLWKIAKRFTGKGENWSSIADKNGIKDPKLLQIGTVLKI